MLFCIYSDLLVAECDSDIEHVVPLSLGGSNSFVIRVSRQSNSRANKEIDEKLARCIFLAANRRKHEAVGHRGKFNNPSGIKGSVGQDKSVVLKFDNNNLLQLYSHRKRKFLTEDELTGESASLEVSCEYSLRMRFGAKAALGAGHFVYGESFSKYVKTSELRAIMNYEGELHDGNSFNNVSSTGWFWPAKVDDEDAPMHSIFEAINNLFQCTFILLITSANPERIIFAVSVLGHLTSVISCPANCAGLPKEGDFDLGHVILLRQGNIKILSYRSCLEQIAA